MHVHGGTSFAWAAPLLGPFLMGIWSPQATISVGVAILVSVILLGFNAYCYRFCRFTVIHPLEVTWIFLVFENLPLTRRSSGHKFRQLVQTYPWFSIRFRHRN